MQRHRRNNYVAALVHILSAIVQNFSITTCRIGLLKVFWFSPIKEFLAKRNIKHMETIGGHQKSHL